MAVYSSVKLVLQTRFRRSYVILNSVYIKVKVPFQDRHMDTRQSEGFPYKYFAMENYGDRKTKRETK
jgi:hypothetical protein